MKPYARLLTSGYVPHYSTSHKPAPYRNCNASKDTMRTTKRSLKKRTRAALKLEMLEALVEALDSSKPT